MWDCKIEFRNVSFEKKELKFEKYFLFLKKSGNIQYIDI